MAAYITDRPLLRPLYSTTLDCELDDWVTDNLPELVGYYEELNPEGNVAELFLEFCRRQFECQQQLDDEPYTEDDYHADEADSLNDAYDVEDAPR